MFAERERQEFAQRRAIKEDLGSLYRALRHQEDIDVDVTVIDPRATFVYLSLVFSQGARYRVPWRERLRTAFTGLSISSVIADGRVVAVGRTPHLDEVLTALRRAEAEELKQISVGA